MVKQASQLLKSFYLVYLESIFHLLKLSLFSFKIISSFKLLVKSIFVSSC